MNFEWFVKIMQMIIVTFSGNEIYQKPIFYKRNGNLFVFELVFQEFSTFVVQLGQKFISAICDLQLF